VTRDPDPLCRELGEALARADPVPPEVLRTARAVFSWRALAAELAALDLAADQPPARFQGWKAFPTEPMAGPSSG
jgi:hypothetical protein